jgi:hypothetical protein
VPVVPPWERVGIAEGRRVLPHDDYVRWAQAEIGWEVFRLKFRRNLTDRGFGAAKGTGGQRLIVGLRLKAPAPLHVASVARPYQGEWQQWRSVGLAATAAASVAGGDQREWRSIFFHVGTL